MAQRTLASLDAETTPDKLNELYLEVVTGGPESRRVSIGNLLGTPVPLGTFEKGVAPSAPPAGDVNIYAKADGYLYSIDENGVETLLSGGVSQSSNNLFQGRLSLTTGVPVTTADVTEATTVYVTPYNGDKFRVYDGSVWPFKTLQEIQVLLTTTRTVTVTSGSPNIVIADGGDTLGLWVGMAVTCVNIPSDTVIISITDSKNFVVDKNATGTSTQTMTLKAAAAKPLDFFIYDESYGAIGNYINVVQWTNTTTRAVALTTQDGIIVKTGAATHRYIGSVYCDVAGQTNDSIAKRHVFNLDNPVARVLKAREATSHTYNGGHRKWNNSDTNTLLSLFLGMPKRVSGSVFAQLKSGSNGSYAVVYLYVDVANYGIPVSNFYTYFFSSSAPYKDTPAVGLHTYQAYETSNANSTFELMETLIETEL